jgi:hypothetical protein
MVLDSSKWLFGPKSAASADQQFQPTKHIFQKFTDNFLEEVSYFKLFVLPKLKKKI